MITLRPAQYAISPRNLQRIAREVTRARMRGAMIAGDRRDAVVMDRAAFDRAESRILPRDRILMDLADLREFDRERDRNALRIQPTHDAGRVWP